MQLPGTAHSSRNATLAVALQEPNLAAATCAARRAAPRCQKKATLRSSPPPPRAREPLAPGARPTLWRSAASAWTDVHWVLGRPASACFTFRGPLSGSSSSSRLRLRRVLYLQRPQSTFFAREREPVCVLNYTCICWSASCWVPFDQVWKI